MASKMTIANADVISMVSLRMLVVESFFVYKIGVDRWIDKYSVEVC